MRGLRPTTSPRRPMARGALVRLQARDGSRTSDNEPSLACRASASITGCVRKSLLRLRPSAYLTRDHRLGAALPTSPLPHLPRPIALVGGGRRSEAGEPTGAREHVCGPGVILTASVKGAREGARVKIMLVGCPQTAGRYPPNEVSREAGAMRGASRSGAGLGHSRRRIGVVGLTRTAEMW